MKKRVSFIALALVLVSVFTGCTSSGATYVPNRNAATHRAPAYHDHHARRGLDRRDGVITDTDGIIGNGDGADTGNRRHPIRGAVNGVERGTERVIDGIERGAEDVRDNVARGTANVRDNMGNPATSR